MLWFVAAAVLELAGVPFLLLEQNGPFFIVVILGAMLLVLAMMFVYVKIEAKYRV